MEPTLGRLSQFYPTQYTPAITLFSPLKDLADTPCFIVYTSHLAPEPIKPLLFLLL